MFSISSLFYAAQSSNCDVQMVSQPKIKVKVIEAANTFPYQHQHQVCDVAIDGVYNSGVATSGVWRSYTVIKKVSDIPVPSWDVTY
jgi:hypothetical protein